MNTMNVPGFTAETSLYKTGRHYQTGRHTINSTVGMVTPALPPCRNCDYILARCEINGWRPRAVCNACASGFCSDEPPGGYGGDPFWDLPRI
jgi:hypothetical protein